MGTFSEQCVIVTEPGQKQEKRRSFRKLDFYSSNVLDFHFYVSVSALGLGTAEVNDQNP
jgi:hypothetical protein